MILTKITPKDPAGGFSSSVIHGRNLLGRIAPILFFLATFLLATGSSQALSAPGSLTPVASYSAGSNPNGVAYSPNGNFLGEINPTTSTVQIFSVGSENSLTAVGTYSTGTDPSSLAYSPNGDYLTVSNYGSASLEVYSVDPTTGILSTVGTYAAGTSPTSVTYSPNGDFLSVANYGSSDVQVYSVDSSSGALTSVNTYSTVADPDALAYSPSGNYLTVAANSRLNTGQPSASGSLESYSVDSSSGALSLVSSAVGGYVSQAAVAQYPLSIAYSPTGNYFTESASQGIYDGEAGVAVFSQNQSTGALEEGNSYIGPSGGQVTYSPSGSFLEVANTAGGNVYVYSVVQVGGALTSVGTYGSALDPSAAAFSPSGDYLTVADANNGSLAVYSVTATAFSEIAPYSITSSDESSAAYSPNGNFLSTTVFEGSKLGIQTYAVNSANGELTAASSVVATGQPDDISYSPNGAFVADGNNTTAVVTIYSANSTTGALTQDATVGSGSGESRAAFSPNSKFLAVVNNASTALKIYSVNQSTGALTLSNSYTLGGIGGGLAYSPNGAFLSVGNGTSSIEVYSVSASTGALTAVGSTPGFSDFLAYSPNGKFLSSSAWPNGTSGVESYEVNQSTGALTEVGTYDTASGQNPYGLAYSPNGQYLTVVNESVAQAEIFSMDSSGALTEVGTYATTSAPFGLAYDPTASYVAVAGASVEIFGTFGQSVDDNVPSIALPATNANWISSPSALSLGASTTGSSGIASITCSNSLNGDTYTVMGSSGTIPTADESSGVNVWSCYSTSGSGVNSPVSTVAQSLDTTSPTVSLPPTNESLITSPIALSVATTAGPSGISSITCSNSLNSDTYTVMSGSGSIPTADESNGANVWTCYATNGAGVASVTESVTENLGADIPVVNVPPTNFSYISTPVALPMSATDSGVGIASITCSNSLNGDTYTVDSASGSIPATDDATGINIWTCSATSNGGVSSSNAMVSEYVDATLPSAVVEAASAGSWQATQASIGVNATFGPSGEQSISCINSLNGDTYSTTSASGLIPAADNSSGVNVWHCVATNNDGVTSATATGLEQLDPSTPTVTVPATSSAWISTPAPIGVSGSSPGPSGISSITCSNSLNGDVYLAPGASGSIPTADEASGVNTWSCVAINGAGTNSAPQQVSESVDSNLPTMVVPTTNGSYISTAVSYGVSATDPASGIASITCRNSLNGDTYTVMGSSGTIPATDESNGANLWTCSARSTAGLSSASAAFSAYLDTEAAQVELPASNPVWVSSATLQLNASSGPSGVASITCNNSLNGDTYTLHSASGLLPNADESTGTNVWTCYSIDNSGVQSPTQTVTVKLDNVTPSLLVPASSSSYSHVDLALPVSMSVGPSGENNVNCVNSLNNDSFTATTANFTLPTTEEGQGVNSWTCMGVNNDSSVLPSRPLRSPAATFTFELDTSVPTVTLPFTYPDYSSNPAPIPVAASESGPSGIASITCTNSLNGAVYTVMSSSGTIPINDEANGLNSWSCVAVTNAGVSGDPVSQESLDTVDPTTTFSTTASESTWYASGSIPQISVTGTVGPSGLQSISCQGDGVDQTFHSLSGNVLDLSNLNSGAGEITCTTTGNSGLSSSAGFAIHEGTPPPGSVIGEGNIMGGALSISPPPTIAFSGTLSGYDLELVDPTPADQSMAVTDATGSFGGWDVTAMAQGPFSCSTGPCSTESLPANALSLDSSSSDPNATASPTNVCGAGSTCSPATDDYVAYPIGIPDGGTTGPSIFDASANSGMGTVNVSGLDWWLAVPANSLAGIYSTSVVVSVNSGPLS